MSSNSCLLLTPDNTIITFDIHGVIFKTDIKLLLKIFWQHPKKYRIIVTFMHPGILLTIARMRYKKSVMEKYLVLLPKKYPQLKQYVPLFLQLFNAQKPHQPTLDLIKTLQQRNYTLHILSNIGEQTFADLQKKYPEIFAPFSYVKVPSPDNGFIGKPNPHMFHEYLHDDITNDKHIIFIDDKPKNIAVAQKIGINSIFFNTAAQVHEHLKKLGIW